jgi:hypothetical protein
LSPVSRIAARFLLFRPPALPADRCVVQDSGVELNELNWDDMLKFGGIGLLALIILARLLMRG